MKKLFGVIGDPIAQSKSPQMFNAAFEELGINATYQHFHVKSSELKSFFSMLRSSDISGVNVTIPHKQKVMEYVDDFLPYAKVIGAVNTIFRQDDNLFGANTDGRGYIKGLKEETQCHLENSNVLVMGSGGASFAVCYALCEQSISQLTIVNRTLAKATHLAKHLQHIFPSIKIRVIELSKFHKIPLHSIDLFVNTTSLGLKQNPWPNLDFVDQFNDKTIVSDIVAYPINTNLIQKAKEKELKVSHGHSMLLYQATIAFELFTKQTAPVEIMKNALLKALNEESA